MSLERDKRKEVRFPVEARVMVRKQDGAAFQARAVDISSSGMRLHLDEDGALALDDEVIVEIELPQGPDRIFSSWGWGRVAHLRKDEAGIQLYCGEYKPSRLSGGGSYG